MRRGTEVDPCSPNPCFPGVDCYRGPEGARCGACPRNYVGDGYTCVLGTTCADQPCARGEPHPSTTGPSPIPCTAKSHFIFLYITQIFPLGRYRVHLHALTWQTCQLFNPVFVPLTMPSSDGSAQLPVRTSLTVWWTEEIVILCRASLVVFL